MKKEGCTWVWHWRQLVSEKVITIISASRRVFD